MLAANLPPPDELEEAPEPSSLSPAERDRYAAELLAGERDAATMEQIIVYYEPLVKHLASRFAHRGEPLDDLLQVANLALIKAAERFDADAGARFSTYAIPTILGEIKRHFRDSGWSMRVPRQLQERALRLRSVMGSLTQELGRSPTVAEMADRAGLELDEVLEALDVIGNYRADSLEENESKEDSFGSGTPPPVEDVRFDLIDGWVHVAPLLRRLPQREQNLLYLRFVEELSQRQIATKLGISQMHVSRLLRRTLQKLRAWADVGDDVELPEL